MKKLIILSSFFILFSFIVKSQTSNIELCGDYKFDGNLGIGVHPSAKLDVNGNINTSGNFYMTSSKFIQLGSKTDINKQFQFNFNGTNSVINFGGILYLKSPRHSNPLMSIEKRLVNGSYISEMYLGNVYDSEKRMKIRYIDGDKVRDAYIENFGGPIYICPKRKDYDSKGLSNNGKPIAMFDENGLTIQGRIRTSATAWADFVFADNYQLPSLKDVKNHIQANKHLPDIPSESEVLEKGIDLAEMQAKLLQKIEELTLYLIQQHEKTEQQQLIINQLKQEINSLKNEK